ncbi:MAG: AMP-binding protein [bacterium]|nr:AMP-binding protein [bacterium]
MTVDSDQILELGVDPEEAKDLLPRINACLNAQTPPACWQKLTQEVLTPAHPFVLHQFLYREIYKNWDANQGPPPAWLPSEKQIQQSNIGRLCKSLNLHTYEELHNWSVQHRSEFWNLLIQQLHIPFQNPYTQLVDLSQGPEFPNWLVHAKLNIAESCFNAAPDAIAIVSQQEDGPLITWTYQALERLTHQVANSLQDMGIIPGDAVAIAMPMTPESVAIYLGIVKAGCAVVGIADSFSAPEIATRLQIAKAKAVFTQDVVVRSGKRLPLYNRMVEAEAPIAVVLSADRSPLPDLRPGDLTWSAFLSDRNTFDAVPCDPSDPTNILFSSGTTGEPKAIPWSHTTPIRAAVDGHLHQNIQPGDVVAWPTNLGWMMGPWLIYAPLVNHATMALFDGAPTGRPFGQFVRDAGVTMLGLVPSLVRVWRASNCMEGLDWQTIQVFSSTGECSDPDDMLFLMALANYKPIIEYCGGTEIGGSYITGTVVQPSSPSTFTTPALGLDFVLLDEGGKQTDNGEVFLLPPSFGLSLELLNKNHHEVYFEGTPEGPSSIPLRRHGDQIERMGGGTYRARGRVDDTMNLGGIKISSTELEETLNAIPGIDETAAIAVSEPNGGLSRLVIYTVTEQPESPESLKPGFQEAISQNLNPLFRVYDVVVVDTLPRTASNKVMRRVLRDQYQKNNLQLAP